MRKLKQGLSSLTHGGLVGKARVIVTRMTDNANFPTPNPALADITLAADNLAEAIVAASSGDRVAIYDRNLKAEALKQQLRLVAYYVSGVADGDGSIITSSGFELQKEREPSVTVTAPTKFEAVRDTKPGAVKLTWKPVDGAKMYIVEVTTTDPVDSNPIWEEVAMTTKSRVEVDNLTFGTYYWYRVKAVGVTSASLWSNTSMVRAA